MDARLSSIKEETPKKWGKMSGDRLGLHPSGGKSFGCWGPEARSA